MASRVLTQSIARGCVSVETDLDALACEWELLAERVDGSPFLRPGWILPWARAFGTGSPEALVVRRDDELVGVLPMQRRRGRLYSLANWHSPLFGPLVADERAREQLHEELFGGRRASVELSLLHGASGLSESARAAGRRVLEREIAACPVVDIEGSFEDYERGLSRNRRRSLRRGLRALEAQGEVTFSVHDSLDGLDAALEELLRVEASGWKGERGTAIASRPETTRFYTDVAHWAAARGWLRLSFLHLDGRAIACDLSIVFDGTWWSLKSGYDECHRPAGPGALLLREQLRRCFAEGAARLELLGVEDDFKSSWTDRTCARTRVHAFDRSAAGLAHWSRVAGRESLRPAVHWMRGRMNDAIARGHHAIASVLAAWEKLGLESIPLGA